MTIPAQQYSVRLNYQFVIAHEVHDVLDGFKDVSFSGLCIQVHRDFDTVKIFDQDGNQIGVFIGVVIDLSRKKVVKNEIVVTIEYKNNNANFEKFENWLYNLCGYWICIIFLGKKKFVYLDAGGSLSAVYSEKHRACASSALMMLQYDEYYRFLTEVESEFYSGDKYFTAGLTAHSNVKRLLINHKLDLDTWSVARIWPRSGETASRELEECLKTVESRTSEVIDVLASHGTMAVPLTAGNETRAMLALAAKQVQNLQFFTARFPAAVVDMGTAGRLAKAFDLPHAYWPVARRSLQDRQQWHERTGHCVGGSNWQSKLVRPMETDYTLSGSHGEFGRGFLYMDADTSTTAMSAETLLKRLNLRATIPQVEAVEEWLQNLPAIDTFHLLDLAYLELRVGCWASPQLSGRDSTSVLISPLAQRAVFDAMTGLPWQFRKSQLIFPRIIARNWPELLQFPINKGTVPETVRLFFFNVTSKTKLMNKLRKEARRLRQLLHRGMRQEQK